VRRLFWIGDSRERVREFPEPVRIVAGNALYQAQHGEKARCAKVFKGADGVFEIVDDHDGDTYRVVYAVKLQKGIYVLHAFQKKSKTGIKTPKEDVALIKARLKRAKEMDSGE
jgi:phage-related protein